MGGDATLRDYAPSWGADRLDLRYARRTYRNRYFRDGFGNVFDALPRTAPLARPWTDDFSFEEEDVEEGSGGTRVGIRYASPDTLLPSTVSTGRGVFFRPRKVPYGTVIALAATGDEGFAHRTKQIALPLLQEGIATLILEAPYYGSRRLPGRDSSVLASVVELGQLFRAQVIEAAALVYAVRNFTGEKVVLTGTSRGAQAAVVAASLLDESPPVVAFLAPYSAYPVFTDGVLRHDVCFDALAEEEGGDLEAAKARLQEMLRSGDIDQFGTGLNEAETIFVHATADGFVPPSAAERYRQTFPNAHFNDIDGGHISSFLRAGKSLRGYLVDAARNH